MTTSISENMLKALLDEISNADPEMLPPPIKKDSGDRHLGYLTDEYAKKVFSLNSFYRREAQRMQVDLEASGEDPHTSVPFNQTKQRHETLMEIFWMLLREEAQLWGKGDIGIRKGWEIVQCNAGDDKVPALLKKLLGG